MFGQHAEHFYSAQGDAKAAATLDGHAEHYIKKEKT